MYSFKAVFFTLNTFMFFITDKVFHNKDFNISFLINVAHYLFQYNHKEELQF